MQDLDNNMDELFRKAGDVYPLKTEADGWDKISPLLLEKPAIFHIQNKKNSLKKYSAFIILLLAFFLLGTITSRYVWKSNTTIAGRINNTILPSNNTEKKDLQLIPTANQRLGIQAKLTSKGQVINRKSELTTTLTIPDPNKIFSSALTDDLISENNAATMETTQQSHQIKSILKIKTDKPDWQELEVVQKIKDTLSNNRSITSVKNTIDSINASTNVASKIANANNEKRNQRKGNFYFGLLAGLSFNQVKNQGLQRPGYDVGFKAGYQFTKQLSIEAGLFFEQKYYYTSGEYFNISKIASTMPVGTKVVCLKGSFSVFELPLTVKYNLPSNNTQGHFYTTAGISTYLMSREYNQYQTLLNGVQNNMTGTYNNQTTYTATSLNISIGYEKTIGKSFLVRVDPYIQVPLKGIGVGALPVTTIGVHLGVFRFKQ